MPNHIIATSYQAGGNQRDATVTKTAGSASTVEEPVNDGQTDLEVAFSLDVSQLAAVYLEADVDMTIETNSGSTPTDTISLTAGEPVMWHNGMAAGSNPFTADVTSNIFVTNSSGQNGTLIIELLVDPTV